MLIKYVKTLQNEEYVGYVKDDMEAGDNVQLHKPVLLIVDPHVGIFCRDPLLFVESNTLVIKRDNVVKIGDASEIAVKYHTRFLEHMEERDKAIELHKESDGEEDHSEEDNVIQAFFDSKNETKH